MQPYPQQQQPQQQPQQYPQQQAYAPPQGYAFAAPPPASPAYGFAPQQQQPQGQGMSNYASLYANAPQHSFTPQQMPDSLGQSRGSSLFRPSSKPMEAI